MSALIRELKMEHFEIIDKLKECRELGIFTRKGKSKLKSVKESLLEHLKDENEKFYPILWKKAEHNKDLKEKLEIFAKDWGNVYSVATEIFVRYDKGVLGAWHSWDFTTLFTVLRNRMRNEENFLYDEYEEMNKQ